MPDFIPSPDDEYNDWLVNLVTYLTTDLGAPVTTVAQKTALNDALTAWQLGYSSLETLRIQFDAAVITKDDARRSSEATVRQIVGDIQRAPATTDTQRELMQVTVPKDHHTATPIVETYPVMEKIDISTRLRHRLFFADSAANESRAKPPGARFCEIREQIGGTAPVEPDSMTPLAMESRAPHRNDFDVIDLGKPVYYAMRWINNTGDPGPWSPIYSAVVPG